MNPCEECPLDDKIYECCGRFPDTGEAVYLQLDEFSRVLACPYLNRQGMCTIYDHRPLGCRSHFCVHYTTIKIDNPAYLDIISYFRDGSD